MLKEADRKSAGDLMNRNSADLGGKPSADLDFLLAEW